MKILITGGAGFVGSNLCIQLKHRYPSYKIIAFDNLKRRGSELSLNRLKSSEVEFIHGDIRNPEDFLALGEIDFIIEAAADPSVLSGINSAVLPLINTNIFGTVNCLELAAKTKASFIFLSTSRVYPIQALESVNHEELNTRFQWIDKQEITGVSSLGITEKFPVSGSRSFYGTSKLASEMIIEEYHAFKGIKTVINRCGVIGGPWQMGKIDQGIMGYWIAQHFFKGKLSYIGYDGKGKQMRDVLPVDDLVNLVDWQIHNMDKVNGQIYNVGGGLEVSFSLLELTKICEEITGNKIQISSVKENRPADVRIYVNDNSKITNHTGWKPQKNLQQLVADTYEWLKNNQQQLKNILQ